LATMYDEVIGHHRKGPLDLVHGWLLCIRGDYLMKGFVIRECWASLLLYAWLSVICLYVHKGEFFK